MCIRDREVPLLPDVTFLGEGPATFNIEEDHTFVIKYRRNNYKNELGPQSVSYTHLRAHETVLDLVCRLLLAKKKRKKKKNTHNNTT